MSMQFWLVLALMAALALVFIFYPVIFHAEAPGQAADRRAQNLLAYRTRLAELEEETARGEISEEEFEALKRELDAGLLDDVDSGGERRARTGRRLAWGVALASVVLVPLVAFGLYGKLGASDTLAEAQTIRAMQQGKNVSRSRMETLLERLRKDLEADPANVDSWVVLSRSYMNLEDYHKAAWAFEQLAAQVEKQEGARQAAGAWGLAAQAHYFAGGEKMTDAARADIKRALDQNPNEITSLGLEGINAFKQGDYRAAVKYWGQILKTAPNHPQIAVIRQGIKEAYKRLGEPVPDSLLAGTKAGRNDKGAKGKGPRMTVDVSLAGRYQDKVAQGDTVFVYAKAVNGPPMPLAVARYKVSDLPVKVTLDDSMAMAPVARLSKASKVMLYARVSPSGSAMPSSGDWIGKVGPLPVQTNTKPIQISIDHQIQ